jgi:hypothetical protein
VTEELLDRAQIGAAVEEVRRERVPERVRARASLDPGSQGRALDEPADPACAQAPAALVEKEGRL